jgi:TatD DNase family protein
MVILMKYIDSHAHYDDERFNNDRDELLSSLYSKGVDKIITVGCRIEQCISAIELAKKHRHVYAAVGIHPEDCEAAPENYLEQLEQWVKLDKVVAIGEIGLDYHYDGFDRHRQIKLFDEQLALAKHLDMPVIIHSRDATADTMEILKKYAPLKGVMHCFSGSAETAKQVLLYGLYISFTGVLTFKSARKAVEALSVVPMDRLLLETDCPYMAPEPFRGQRCDSSMIVKVIDRISELKRIEPESVAQITMENTLRLFPKLNL